MRNNDTIAAIASGVGGAVSVIRVSGTDAEAVCGRVWSGQGGRRLEQCGERQLVLGGVQRDGAMVDPSCLAVRMPGPHSFTGENVVELHCHGGGLCSQMVLEAVLAAGARLAEPGEFSRRAFMNGKLDLVQAEAIADMIQAGSREALQLAAHQLKGELGTRIRGIQQRLQNLLAEAESRLDFPEENLDWIPEEEFNRRLETIRHDLIQLWETRTRGELLREGVSLVIAGPPNAGKSTLLNRLLGRERAIVSDTPGTTRDTIEVTLQLGGIPFHLTDTAGIREQTADAIESAGMERTREAAECAQLVVWLQDGTRPLEEQAVPPWNMTGKLLRVLNKCDQAVEPVEGMISISALTGQGMEALSSAMIEAVMGGQQETSDIAVAARHGELLFKASESVCAGLPCLKMQEWELLAYHLREAVLSLRLITGETVAYDVLDMIFAKFCIGK